MGFNAISHRIASSDPGFPSTQGDSPPAALLDFVSPDILHPRKMRVVMYSHDTYGLGHLTRTVRIAHGVMSAFPGARVLVISGSPVAHSFAFPRGVDYVKIPSVVKSGPEAYEARELGISFRTLRQLRSAIILDTIKIFRPHLFFVDNVPLGMKGELRPILEWLRNKQPQAQIHLNLRDILDDPRTLLPIWEKTGVQEVLQEFYDTIHVFGCRSVYDAVAAYGLPQGKTDHLGYICPPPEGDREEKPMAPPREEGRWRILVTVGGGGDGNAILRCVLRLQKFLGPLTPFRFFMVAGPLMNPESYREICQEAKGIKGVYLYKSIEHLSSWMAQSDLVLSMGGYNTLCEVMAFARRSVVIPRIYPRTEQMIRVRALEAKGILRVIEPDELNPDKLNQVLCQTLESENILPLIHKPSMNGINHLQQRLFDMEVVTRSHSCHRDRFSFRYPGQRASSELYRDGQDRIERDKPVLPESTKPSPTQAETWETTCLRETAKELKPFINGTSWEGRTGQVAYLTKMFPRISETFILSEVLSLRRLSVPVRIYSLLQPTRDHRMHDEVGELLPKLVILPDPNISRFAEFLSFLLDCFRVWPLATSKEILRLFLHPTRQSFRRLFRATALAVQMRQDHVAHLHAAWAHTPASVARIASRLTGIPWSMGTHAKDIHLSAPQSLRKKIDSAHFTMACSRANRDLLMHIGSPCKADLPAPSITLLHHGVDTEYFYPKESDLNTCGSEDPLILSVGRLVPKKGFDILLQAAALMKRQGMRFRLHLIGEGTLRPHIEQQIHTLGLKGDVLMRGLLVREEVRNAYHQAACVALAARITPEGDRDGIPNTLAEAMACGVPVVASRLEGISELVEHGVSGLLVRPEDPSDLAEALSLLLRDTAFRQKMGQSARHRIIRIFDSRPLHERAAQCFQNSIGIRKLLYVTADRGVPVRGSKGASIHVRSLLQSFRRLGVDGLVLTTWPGPADGPAISAPLINTDAQGYIKRIAMGLGRWTGSGPAGKRQILRFLDNLLIYRKGVQQARAWHPDFIYERYSLLSFAGAFLAHRLRIPHVLEVNAPLADEEARFRGLKCARFTRWMERWIMRSAHRVVVVSQALKEHALGLGVCPDRILVLPNGVNPDLFHPGCKGIGIRERLGWKTEDFIVGFSGTFKPWHGVDHLLRALAQVVPLVASSRLLLVGDGPGRIELEHLAEKSGLKERVFFTGSVHHDEVPEYLAACDVLVAPYRPIENFYFSPIKVAEYMALGKPVVVSAIGQLKELIHDSHSVIGVPPGDEEALARVLIELAQNPLRRKALGQLSVCRSPGTWEDAARKILSEGERIRRGIWRWKE